MSIAQSKKNTSPSAQGRNQEFFRAREVLWNTSTSINISSTTHQKRRHLEKFGSFFLLDTLKTTLLMRNFNNKRTQSGHIFKKSGHFL